PRCQLGRADSPSGQSRAMRRWRLQTLYSLVPSKRHGRRTEDSELTSGMSLRLSAQSTRGGLLEFLRVAFDLLVSECQGWFRRRPPWLVRRDREYDRRLHKLE